MKRHKSEDLRTTIRHPLLGDLSGQVLDAETGSPIPCLALDVSSHGLKLIAFVEVAAGANLVLKVESIDIPLTVIWCKAEHGKVPHFICGVEATDKNPELSLERLFTERGWLKTS